MDRPIIISRKLLGEIELALSKMQCGTRSLGLEGANASFLSSMSAKQDTCK